MFSKSLIVGTVALAFVTVGWLTVQSATVTPPTAAPSMNIVTGTNEVQHEQTDARTGASASTSAVSGVVYHYDSVTNKWYAYHYSSMSMGGPLIDDSYEIAGDPFAVTTTSGWVYYQDQLTAKWYTVHYSISPTGPVIDDSYEIVGKPEQAGNTCGTTIFQPECFGSASFSVRVSTINGCGLERNVPDC